jgi:hypothetical protein
VEPAAPFASGQHKFDAPHYCRNKQFASQYQRDYKEDPCGVAADTVKAELDLQELVTLPTQEEQR